MSVKKQGEAVPSPSVSEGQLLTGIWQQQHVEHQSARFYSDI